MDHKYTKCLERVELVPLQRGDIEVLRELRNNPLNRKWFRDSNEISKEVQEKWFSNYLLKDNDIMLVAKKKESGETIGFAALYNINYKEKEGEFGRIIIDHEKVEGKGWGQEVLEGMIKIAFNDLKLEHIYLEVFENNKRAIALYQKLNFIIKNKVEKMVVMELKKV